MIARVCVQRVAIVLIGAVGCNAIAGIREAVLRQGDECTTIADCLTAAPACRSVLGCEAGQCVFGDATHEEGPDCCGNGTTQTGEECDDGNADSTDGCTTSCKLPACGDGFWQPGAQEECDDGNADSTDGCTSLCALPVCSDGFAQAGAGESCDDGNLDGGDGCSSTCTNEPIQALSAGTDCECAITSIGAVKCWGRNDTGQLGLGDTNCRGDVPNEMGANLPAVSLGTGKTATAIASHGGVVTPGSTTCVILDDGSVKCWGRNDLGQLGLGDTQYRGDGTGEMGDSLPTVSLGAGRTAVAISVGGGHVCTVLDDANVKCWGDNSYGQLGLGDTARRGDDPNEMGDSLPAVDLGAGRTAVAIATGHEYTCAILDDTTVKCWGRNVNGMLGLGDSIQRGDDPNEMGDSLPTVSFGAGNVPVAIDSRGFHACALLVGGSVKCWGQNDRGQLGLGDTAHRGDDPNEMGDNLPAVNLGTGRAAIAVTGGFKHSCALLDDSSVKCWGFNGYGQLGLGDTSDRGHVPTEMGDNLLAVDLGGGNGAMSITTGAYQSCAQLTDGSVKCWGSNYCGALGLGNTEFPGDEPNEMGDNLPTVKLFSDVW